MPVWKGHAFHHDVPSGRDAGQMPPTKEHCCRLAVSIVDDDLERGCP